MITLWGAKTTMRRRSGDDLVAAGAPDEVALEALRRDVGDRGVVVDAARSRARASPGCTSVAKIFTGRSPRRAVSSSSKIASEYTSSPVAQPATHTRNGVFFGSPLDELREHALAEDVEGLLVPEEARHADEQIAVEHVELVAPAPQALDVRVHVVRCASA